MAVYQVGQNQYEIPDEIQGSELQGVLQGLARLEAGTTQQVQTPASQILAADLPEIGESPELNELSKSGFLSSLAASFITDPKELGQALTQQIPGSFVSRDSEGNPIVNFPSGQFAINKPEFSAQDLVQFVTRAAAFTPAGAVRGTLGQKALQAGAKSAAIEGAIQAGEEKLGGELDTGEALFAGAFGAAAEPVLAVLSPALKAGIGRLKDIKASRIAAREGLERGGALEGLRKAQIAQESIKQTEIPLTRAQQTLDPSLLEEQSFVASLPEGSKRGVEFLTKQNEAAGMAVTRFLSDIAPSGAVVTGPTKIRSAAQKAIDIKRQVRSEATSPLYNEAFDGFQGRIDIDPLLDEISLRMAQYPDNHPAAIALKGFSDDIIKNADSLRKLHGVKETVDTKIANFTTGKTTAAINKAKREATEVQQTLVGLMEEASPQYAQARRAFIDESGGVEQVETLLSGIADLTDDKLKNVSRAIFDPAQTNPEVIRQTRRLIRNTEGGNEAWNEIIRNEFERRLGSAKNELSSVISGDLTATQNAPAQILNALGLNNVKNKKVIRNALNAQQRKNLDFLESSLKRAASGRPGGSQTATRAEISKKFDKGFVAGLRKWMSSPLATASEIGEEGARAARIRAISDSVFDETWTPQVDVIRKLEAAGKLKEAERKAVELLNRVERANVSRGLLQGLRSEGDQ